MRPRRWSHGSRPSRPSYRRLRFPPISWPATQSDRDVAKMIAGQAETFAERHRELVSQTDILNQRIAQAQTEIGGRQAQIAAEDRQTKPLADQSARRRARQRCLIQLPVGTRLGNVRPLLLGRVHGFF